MITVLVADPARLEMSLPDGLLFASGFHPEAAEVLRRDPSGERTAELCRELGDASAIRLTTDAGRVVRLDAWRGVTSAFEIFYALRADGGVLVSDQFRNILAEIPVAERRPSDTAILDHLLFRTVPGVRTYARGVDRLGHGEHLVLHPGTGAPSTRIFDRIGRSWERGTLEQYLDRLDQGFNEAVARFGHRTQLVSLFSGGIDSSLLQTYLERNTRAVFYQPERVTPGTPDPTRYAMQSAKLLKIELETRRILDDETWEHIERNIEMAGWPQRVIQAAMYADAFPRDGSGFVLGERADALFGAAGTRSAAVGAKCSNPFARIGLRCLAALPLGGTAKRAQGLLETSSQLQVPATSPLGWAAGMSSRGFSDYAIVADIVGEKVLYERVAERLNYVAARLQTSPQPLDQLTAHLELAHWIDYLCEDHPNFIRQLGLAHGKSVILPFLAQPVVGQALTIPADERYLSRGETKYLLKALLKRRLPEYPVNQRKGITSMMMPRTYHGRDRRTVWEKFPMPAFIPQRHHAALMSFENSMSNTVLRLAILEQRVLSNAALSTTAGARRIDLPVRSEPSNAPKRLHSV
jgi:asparagine synthetase B (glutamine-hydrolysing)